jgi:hypothetical protein
MIFILKTYVVLYSPKQWTKESTAIYEWHRSCVIVKIRQLNDTEVVLSTNTTAEWHRSCAMVTIRQLNDTEVALK